MASLSLVIEFAKDFTSSTSFFISAEAVGGGGAGLLLTMSVLVIIQAFTPRVVGPNERNPKKGNMGGRAGVSRLCHGISPREVALSASACHCALFPPAVPIRSVLARSVNTVATAFPS